MSATAVGDTAPAKEYAATVRGTFSFVQRGVRPHNAGARRFNFLAEDWRSAQLDAVGAHRALRNSGSRDASPPSPMSCKHRRTDVALWSEIKRAYEMLVARRPDSDFYRTFLQLGQP